jgi:hypothetical protein
VCFHDSNIAYSASAENNTFTILSGSDYNNQHIAKATPEVDINRLCLRVIAAMEPNEANSSGFIGLFFYFTGGSK